MRDLAPAMSLPAFLLLFAGLVVVHELIHALVHPMAGRSSHSIVGFGLSVGFYAHYDGELSRNRLVAILLMPLLVISIVPLLVSAVAQVSSGWAAPASRCSFAMARCKRKRGRETSRRCGETSPSCWRSPRKFAAARSSE
jgi:hypothetical protein